ncbi:hypothetical protein [Pollutibacter soli]|uniref:hypothetical protein n=1 Tax=Pollutibacter soli TaxID=3034157 RepID=UPI003013B61E
MDIRRLSFIAMLLLLFVCPFYIINTFWLMKSAKAEGIAAFQGKEFAGQLVHNYTVVMFVVKKDTFFYNTSDNIFFQPGTAVPIRYQKKNPADAKLGTWSGIWMGCIFYSAMPLLIILILLAHPSLIPYRSSVRLSFTPPFIFINHPPDE